MVAGAPLLTALGVIGTGPIATSGFGVETSRTNT